MSIGREPHELVFAAIDLETAIIREGGVQEPQRVREVKLAEDLDVLALSPPDRRRRPFSHAVEGEDRGFLEGRRIKSAGRVRKVMLGELSGPCPGRASPTPR